jgi:L-lactate dehydrogenase complex protein LldG
MTTQSRRRILDSLRALSIPEVPLPPLEGPWVTYADLREQFRQTLAGVGGQCQEAANASAARQLLEQYAPWRESERRLLLALEPNATPEEVSRREPHAWNDLQALVAPGELAVAENGAVWVDERQVGQRSILFLTRHLVLVVRSSTLVANMHEAYARLSIAESRYGCFASGPSKTADIEQSLVIGAHGPQSLLVILLDDG